MVEVLPLMSDLKSFTWKSGYEVPIEILRILEDLSSRPRLIIDPNPPHSNSDWDEEDDSAGLKGLDGCISPLVDTIFVYSAEIDDEFRDPYEQCVSKMLRSCQNIRSVQGARTPWREDRVIIPIHPGPQGQLPPVNEISYMPIDFFVAGPREWEKLKKLKVDSIDDLAPYEGTVPHLEYLTIFTYGEDLTITDWDWGLELGPLQKNRAKWPITCKCTNPIFGTLWADVKGAYIPIDRSAK